MSITAEQKPPDSDSSILVEDSKIARLRGRWELASVLNFLKVFKEVIGDDLKLSAEEIERGLVRPNGSNSQLHIKLLKGIPPVSKTLNGSDSWVTVLCKKLDMWWPWVADGDVPLTAANGEEISAYKKLDPVIRLLILKALCEIRADQDDVVLHINAGIKSGGLSSFRMEKIGADGTTSYWCDGNPVIGHRLYKEVNMNVSRAKAKGKASDNVPPIKFQWETLATNLEEFHTVVDKLSSSKVASENSVAKAIEADTLPVVEKIQKNKDRALKRKERQEKLLNDMRLYKTGITRSCRSRRTISYTFDDYDRAINEAIEVSRKSKPSEDQKHESNRDRLGNINSNEDSDIGTDLKANEATRGDLDMDVDSNGNIKGSNFSVCETEGDNHRESSNEEDNDDSDDDFEITSNDDNDHFGRVDDTDEERDNPGRRNLPPKHFGSRWSLRLTGNTQHTSVETINLGAKNRLRQRPTRNSALDHFVADSGDENSSEHRDGKAPGHENLSPIANSDEVSDGER